MKALVLRASKGTAQVEEIDAPVPGPTEILVRVGAVALNPVDWIFVYHYPIAAQEQRVVGSDFAGTVVGVGEALRDNATVDERTRLGTRVAGFVQGACSINDRPGAFAEFVAIPYDLVWRVPDSLSLEQASSISLNGITAVQTLFGRLGLPGPFGTVAGAADAFQGRTAADGPVNVFIYGASTSLGLYMAQIVRLAEHTTGQKVRLIGTASKARHGLLKQKPYEYDAVVDYRDDNWPEQVRAATEGKGVDIATDWIASPKATPCTGQRARLGRKEGDWRCFEMPQWEDTTLRRCALSPYTAPRGIVSALRSSILDSRYRQTRGFVNSPLNSISS
ncbi:chaperonin 10-like protein [Hypomontagnella monticulosa]|nr:chaperonin 10-like protein [Hypomontagnella monticulosa]